MAVVSFASNVSSLLVQRMLARSSNAQSASAERLSSGLRINRASDDAAGLAIADKLGSDRRLFGAAIRNVNDAISLLNIASDAQSNQNSILMRLAELAEQSANGVYTDQQRSTLNAEYQKLLQEFGRVGSSTTFNGLNLLSGGRGTAAGNSVSIQAGINGQVQSNLGVALSDSGALSGTMAFSQLASYGVRNSLTDQELNAFYGSNLLYTAITDQSGKSRQLAIALTRGVSGEPGQQDVEVQVYQRVSDTGGVGTGSAVGLVESASDTWIQAGSTTLSINAAGRVVSTSAAIVDVAFQNNSIPGQLSIDLRGLQFSGNIAAYSSMASQLIGVVEAGLSVSPALPGDNFILDLGADSFNLAQLVLDIEGDFGIDIVDEQLENIETVGDLMNLVAGMLGYNNSTGQSAIDFSGLDTQERSRVALDVVRARQADLATSQGTLGASQSRLERTLSVLAASRDNYAEAESRIRDVDVAQEAAKLVAAQTSIQAGTSILASANNQPALLLSLLRV